MDHLVFAHAENKKSFCFSKLSVVCLIFLLTGCGKDEPQHYIEEGKMLFEQGDLEGARVQFRNALQLDPKLSDAYFRLALIDEQKQALGSMLGNLLETLAINPNNLEAQIKLGQIYLTGGQLDKAFEHAKMALQLSPENPSALLLESSIQFHQGKNSEAMQGVERVLAKHPFLSEAIGLKANILGDDHKADEAITLLRAGVEHNPDDPDLRLLKARLEITNKNFDQAVHDYEVLIALRPEDIDLPVSLINLMSENGREHEAEDMLREVINKHPSESELKLKLVALIEKRDVDLAEKTLKNFIAESPQDTLLKFHLADYYIARRHLRDAESLLQGIANANEIGKDSLAAKIKLAEIALLQQNIAEVARLANEVLNVDANNSDALLLRAGMRLQNNDSDGAIADLRIVLRDRPNSEQAMLLLAQASLLKGEMEVAESQWRNIVETNPGNMAAVIPLADRLLKRGDHVKADELLLKAAKANPSDPTPFKMLIQRKATNKDWEGAQAVVKQFKAMPETGLPAKYWEGFLLAQQGHTNDAIKAYQDILANQPDNLQTLVALTQLYETTQHRSELIAYLKSFTAKNPTSTSALDILGSAYIAETRWEDAEKTLRAACETSPDDMDLKLKLVNVVERQSESRAEATLKTFLKDKPHEARLKFRLAGFYADHKRYPEAESLLREVINDDITDREILSTHLKLAELAWIQNDLAGAKTILEEIIQKASTHNEALMMRASILMAAQDFNTAIVDLKRVLENQPDFEPALLLVAQAYQKTGNQKELIAYLTSLLQKKTDEETVQQILAMAYATDKNWVEAEKLLHGILKNNPKDAQSYALLARVLAGQGKDTAVENTYQDGLAASPENLDLMNERANFYVFKKNFDKAIEAYEAILKKFPKNDAAANNLADLLVTYRVGNKASVDLALKLVQRFKDSTEPALQDTYGWVHFKAADLTPALPALQKAAEGIPSDARVHYHLGEAYQLTGNPAAAISELEKSLALAQENGEFFEIETAKSLLTQLRN